MTDKFWTDEKCAQLRELVASNAKPRERAAPRVRRPTVRVHQKRIFGGDQVEIAPEPLPLPTTSADDAARDRSSLKTLLELGQNDCRWPIDNPDGGFLFCSSPALDGRPYCAAHSRRAYNPQAYRNALRVAK